MGPGQYQSPVLCGAVAKKGVGQLNRAKLEEYFTSLEDAAVEDIAMAVPTVTIANMRSATTKKPYSPTKNLEIRPMTISSFLRLGTQCKPSVAPLGYTEDRLGQ